MKVFRYITVLVGAAVTGLLVWRKVESDRLREDLWTQAESISPEKEAAVPRSEPVAAPVGRN